MTKFLINKNGVYYLTTGRLLTYDPSKAKDEREKEGCEKVKKKFDEIRNAPCTFYEAVEITAADFGPLNTGQIN